MLFFSSVPTSFKGPPAWSPLQVDPEWSPNSVIRTCWTVCSGGLVPSLMYHPGPELRHSLTHPPWLLQGWGSMFGLRDTKTFSIVDKKGAMWGNSDGSLAKSCSRGFWMSWGCAGCCWWKTLGAQGLVDTAPEPEGLPRRGGMGWDDLHVLLLPIRGSDASQHRLASLYPTPALVSLSLATEPPRVTDPPCSSPLPVLTTFALSLREGGCCLVALSPSLLSGLYYSMNSMFSSTQGFVSFLWISKSLAQK